MESSEETKKCALKEAIKENHDDLVNTLRGLEAQMETCKEENARRTKEQEDRGREEGIYEQRKGASMSELIASANELLELKAAQRQERMRMAMANQDEYQTISDELKLHHNRMMNIISEGLAFPSSSSYTESTRSSTAE